MWFVRAFAALALAALSASAVAQQPQQQQDPFSGQFGAVQIARPPPQAARLSQLMGEALRSLQPQRPGQQDVYIVVAALWNAPVFESEATQAEQILRAHLHAEGRTIVLTAGGGGERRFPAATPDNVAAALGQVGSLINPAEDLVVMFITTHGSSDGAAALRDAPYVAGSLRPANLRDLFSQAGIVNRVVIVSACYSGAFVAPLMDDNTVVLTAAAPDRSSFGCQPEREWTFFGDAYFNHAVRGGAALLPAFDQAKTLIAQWERAQNLSPPSNPQAWVGGHAAEMLRRAEAAH